VTPRSDAGASDQFLQAFHHEELLGFS
jgi:hypothetical protein